MSKAKPDHKEQAESSSAEILLRALRVLREEGVRATVSRTASALGSIRATRRCSRALRRLPEDMTVPALLDFSYKQPISPWQIRSEIEQLAQTIAEQKPRTVVEIGTASGGTLFLWARLSHPEAIIISIDLPGGPFGGGYAVWLASLYRSFALSRQRIHLIRGDSHSHETAGQVRALLRGRPIDFAFIDGDHTYDGVKRDFELYSPLLAPQGSAAFHDIASKPGHENHGVARFWDELKLRYRCREIIADPQQGRAGIGVLWV
jgi:cephalosporin hydroxylase